MTPPSTQEPKIQRITTATTAVVGMDRDALRAWIAERPEIAEQLLRVLARRLQILGVPSTVPPPGRRPDGHSLSTAARGRCHRSRTR
jgi:CRP-like cAMP-binding protein